MKKKRNSEKLERKKWNLENTKKDFMGAYISYNTLVFAFICQLKLVFYFFLVIVNILNNTNTPNYSRGSVPLFVLGW